MLLSLKIILTILTLLFALKAARADCEGEMPLAVRRAMLRQQRRP
jgi:hypothetical protein